VPCQATVNHSHRNLLLEREKKRFVGSGGVKKRNNSVRPNTLRRQTA